MEKTTPIEKFARYLSSMTNVRPFAMPETSFYAALTNLLNSVGDELTPKVQVIEQLRDSKSGLPDYGFYTATQLKLPKIHLVCH